MVPATMTETQASPRALPARFQTSRATLLADRVMTRFIQLGGIGVIAAVCGIFVFIFSQTLPLFQGARIEKIKTVALHDRDYRLLGVDEWSELPFVVDSEGIISFIDLKGSHEINVLDPAAQFGKTVTAFDYNFNQQQLIYGTEDGQFFFARLNYHPVYEGDKRRIEARLENSPLYDIGEPGVRLESVTFGGLEEQKLIVAVQGKGPGKRIYAVTLVTEQTLFGSGEPRVGERYDLTTLVPGVVKKILVNSQGDAMVLATEKGEVYSLWEVEGEIKAHQVFLPFEDVEDPVIASMDYLLGEVSLVFTNSQGLNRIFSLYVPKGAARRLYGLTKEFKPIPGGGGAGFYNASVRNKAFLLGNGSFVSLRYGTTEAVRWEKELPFVVSEAVLGRKYERILFLDTERNLHLYRLEDPHPEAGFKTFFGKVWYEGYSEPAYEWQTTGISDDYESKFSVIPLISGTLKGAFYALIFALPIAILAALYTSQFGHPKFKLIVKPTMEIMASLPSVVLGFLAALWLAPIIETRIPSVLAMVILIPGLAYLAGFIWTSLSVQYRRWVQPGYEWIALIPVVAMAGYLGWQLGPVLERIFFVVTDPDTGNRIADFRLWWPKATGTSFDQRNSLVVGFMMGFAVIPIIFTIAEDALSNVPRALISGSLALGASRWQTAIRVILPTAFPGIFSAVMIGLGRAVGETMIVVMATGNTPITEWNIFSGMRTLSANIAVELPEAPYLGTLYRTLFLGAVLLFVMTFAVNTVAEIVRQRFREKYKTV